MTSGPLPRFLLPRLSWQTPISAARLAHPSTYRSVLLGTEKASWKDSRPGVSYHTEANRERLSVPSLSRNAHRQFHATALRQRDHHFDTLKFVKRLQEEGLTEEQSVAIVKLLNDVIQESIQNITRTMVLREDSDKAKYTQQVDFAKLRSEVLSADSTEANTMRNANERLTNEIAKLSSRLRDEIGRASASARLDLNLEKGRIREETVKQELKIKETEARLEQEVATLKEKLEQVKFQSLQWLVGVCTGSAALMLGAWRLLM